MNPAKEQILQNLHDCIMRSATDWAKAKSCKDFMQGMLVGFISAWWAMAEMHQLEGREKVYDEYKALWFEEFRL